jgi:hypothetical protein
MRSISVNPAFVQQAADAERNFKAQAIVGDQVVINLQFSGNMSYVVSSSHSSFL